MTREQQEKLVYLVDSGRNTYQDIKQSLPEITDTEMRYASVMAQAHEPRHILDLSFVPEKPFFYKFQNGDTFHLTEEGQNVLYAYKKEHCQKIMTAIAAGSGAVSALLGVIALLSK